MPLGAEPIDGGTVTFRVWAPQTKHVAVVLHRTGSEHPLQPDGHGYHSGQLKAEVGDTYGYRLDGSEPLPDPASRFQPSGHDGPSAIVDPCAYRWQDGGWKGLTRRGQVLYEMHIGTFTPEGTWQSAAEALPWLAELGVTALEVMPVCEFPGEFGWGYDLVHFYAPTRLYGTPDDMRAFVDRAHALGMGVIVDVVFNHSGSFGCFLSRYSSDYFSRRHKSDWGNALNFDDSGSEAVREYILCNVEYWTREFHLDGFRLDATQAIFDETPDHILTEIGRRARAAAAPRSILLIGENEPQHVSMLEPAEAGGGDLDALWNDDFHHPAHVALTGRTEAYYRDYRGTPQEFISAARHGFLYQGQRYAWQKQRRGSSTRGYDATRFVHYVQNHDQVANSTRGLRLHDLTSPGCLRTITALTLLLPQTPMLFQGQEFAASTPFLFFADHEPEQAEIVRKGRAEFLSQFQSVASGGSEWLSDPSSRETFERSKLRLQERESHVHVVALHRDLLKLRRTDPVFAQQDANAIEGAVLDDEAFVIRFFGEAGDRLLLINLGRELHLSPCPQPLLAPPHGSNWQLVWSSEEVDYGGDGTPVPENEAGEWHLPARSALVMSAPWNGSRPPLPGHRPR